MKILLVENNAKDAERLKIMLDGGNSDDFHLIHRSSLAGALGELTTEEIDVVLLDLDLPGRSGLDALAQVKTAGFAVPIVVMTDSDNETNGLAALRLGAQDYLSKNRIEQCTLTRALHCAVERNHFSLLREMAIVDGQDDTLPSPPVSKTTTLSSPSAEKAEVGFKSLNHAGFAEILENERVLSFFQSWVSLKEQSIVGFEGLCRGIGEEPNSLISPTTLLRFALHHRLLSSLDRLFRRKVFEGFQETARSNPNLVLSVNFATPTLDDGDGAEEDFSDLAREFKIDPGHVAIEILESHVHDPRRLKRFIQTQRDRGFLIALDDIGSGYSGLNRISELEPDLIKIDRSLVAGIHLKHHQQEVFKSVVRLAHGIGAQTIAEGVETEEELMMVLRLGADMVQGYYFSLPGEMGDHLWEDSGQKIYEANKKFRRYIAGQINEKRSNYSRYDEMIRQMADLMSFVTPKGYDDKLRQLLRRHHETERLFVLDDGGAQLSLMMGRDSFSKRLKALSNACRRGTNHSAKDYYYYHIENGFQRQTFVTEPYLSSSSGAQCVTVSILFKNAYGHTSILCADIGV